MEKIDVETMSAIQVPRLSEGRSTTNVDGFWVDEDTPPSDSDSDVDRTGGEGSSVTEDKGLTARLCARETIVVVGSLIPECNNEYTREKDESGDWKNVWISDPTPVLFGGTERDVAFEICSFNEGVNVSTSGEMHYWWMVRQRISCRATKSVVNTSNKCVAFGDQRTVCPTEIRYWYHEHQEADGQDGYSPSEFTLLLNMKAAVKNTEAQEAEKKLRIKKAIDHYAIHPLIVEQEQENEKSMSGLPIDDYRMLFYHYLANDRVVVVKGGTGCGKSTKLPLYILAENAQNRIIVTQPRRLGAMRLANTVNNMACGDKGHKVVAGYRVGGKRLHQTAPIQFVTVDYLLVRVINDPDCLRRWTHVILDEMHERGPEAEFLYMLLRTLFSTEEYRHIKIVLTSATLEDTFLRYFNPILNRPVTPNHPLPIIIVNTKSEWNIQEIYIDDMKQEDSKFFNIIGNSELVPFMDLLYKHAQSSAYWYMERDDPYGLLDFSTKLAMESVKMASALLRELCFHYSWDEARWSERWDHQTVLLFVPGAAELQDVDEEIRKMGSISRRQGGDEDWELYWEYDWVDEKGHDRTSTRPVSIFWMHSQFPEQMEGYDAPVQIPGEFRILIATNIAETGITIPRVSVVIDMGLEKCCIYDDKLSMSQLLVTICSQASITQRRGRTGRTCNGINIRLFSRELFSKMKPFTPPGTERQCTTRLALRASQVSPKVPEHQAYCGRLVKKKIGDGEKILMVYYKDYERGKYTMIDPELELPGRAFSSQKAILLSDEELSKWEMLETSPMDLINLLPTVLSSTQIDEAYDTLELMGCTNKKREITVMGSYCLSLPLDIHTARMVFIGNAAFDCLLDVILVAAATEVLSSRGDCIKRPRTRSRKGEDMNVIDLKMMIRGNRARMDTHFAAPTSNHVLGSEPVALVKLFIEVLKENQLSSAKGAISARRNHRYSAMIQPKGWMEFIECASATTESLEILVGHDDLQKLSKFKELLTKENDFISEEARMSLDHFKIKTEPRAVIALIGFAQSSRFLLYGRPKKDLAEFSSKNVEMYHKDISNDEDNKENEDLATGSKPYLDPTRTIRLIIESELPDGGDKIVYEGLELGKILTGFLWNYFHNRSEDLPETIKQLHNHFLNIDDRGNTTYPPNIVGNLVQFPPMDGYFNRKRKVRLARMSRLFMEVLLRVRMSQNSPISFIEPRSGLRFTITQANPEIPNKLSWEYVLPRQLSNGVHAGMEPRCITYTMHRHPEHGSIWAVAGGARAKTRYESQTITMSSVTVLHNMADLKWILTGRPFQEGVKVRMKMDTREIFSVQFNNDFLVCHTPVGLDEVNDVRNSLKDISDRIYHRLAGNQICSSKNVRGELKETYYSLEFLSGEIRITNAADINEYETDEEKVFNVCNQFPDGEQLREFDMLHKGLIARLRKGVVAMMKTKQRKMMNEEELEEVTLYTVGSGELHIR